MDDATLSKLERLTNLKAQGAITATEFDLQKAKLLGNEVAGSPRPVPPPKKIPIWKAILYGIIGLVFVSALGSIFGEKPAPIPDLSPKDKATQDSLAQIDAVNRKRSNDMEFSYIKARRAIKNGLKDPDSFEEIEHKAGSIDEKGVYVVCQVKYRAKNSFGGYSIETAMVRFNDKMEPISVKQTEWQ